MGKLTKGGKTKMRKNSNSSSIVVNITGNNNAVIINDSASLTKKTSRKKGSFKTWLKALGKLIRSAFVNILVLLLEIFAKLG